MAEPNPTIEEWRTVAEFPAYSVSNLGRVRRDAPWRCSNEPRVLRSKVTTGSGYLQASLYRSDGSHVTKSIHRLVLEAFEGKRPGMTANHKDGIKTHNTLQNLEWVTPSRNRLHAVRVLGCGRGERHGSHKLTAEQVREIRALYAQGGHSQRALARDFGITQPVVGKIVRRQLWAHID